VIGLGRLERYVLRNTLAAVAGALAVITGVIMLVEFVDISRTVGVRSDDAGFGALLTLTLLKAPATILALAPFVFLFGTLAAFVNLNRRSELIAMRAAGVSAWRFILPAAAAAALIGILTVTALNPLTAWLTGRFETQRTALMEGYLANSDKPSWLRQGDNNTQIVIRATRRDRVDNTIRLRGVSLFVFTRGANGALEFSRRIEASEARLVSGFWRLTNVREALPGAGSLSSESLSIPSTLDQRSTAERFNASGAVGVAFWRLPGAIVRTEQAGFSATPYRLRLQQLFATPLLYAAMSILAAAFSLRLMRLGGLAALAGSGVGLGFVIFFFNQLCEALGKSEVIVPFAAAWAPPILALLAGFTLLCYTEDG
jgi:lipopolysaccharide export system permease protein